ncbi:MAG: hypothetical protein SP1CHLAM54_03000 [Chlamydiia bacterium]|nr:hypothetical protein [Chlamydiia bacterium]MCH9615216.1 hypothetical protein [Chlamydiia bacterium]MCH9628462.1 hypothetical protein [Chlamydiia bacterium]
MIPIRISPFFWLTAAFIGWMNSGMNIIAILIWIVIIFVSIMVHEFGHALTSKAFGQNPRIELVAFGGLTIPEGPRLKLWKEFLVVLFGPLFGFILFLLASFLTAHTAPPMQGIFRVTAIVNLFWTVINLLPVLPLDGGQLIRIILEAIFGVKGYRYATICSAVLSLACGLAGFMFGQLIIGVLFFLFAFQNFQAFKQLKGLTDFDRGANIQEDISHAEELLLQKRYDEAKDYLEKVRQEAGKGVYYSLATQYLGRLYHERGDRDKTYQLLVEVEKDLTPPSRILLHEVAYDRGDFERVLKLAGQCFQDMPSSDIAYRTAKAAAQLKDVEATVGWLRAAFESGEERLNLDDSVFDPVRSDPRFKNPY